MAKLFNKTGYSVVETNHVAAVRNGRIKAQYPCIGSDELENGMLAVVLDSEKVVRKPIDATEACHLHASEERIYESHLGRKGWVLNCKVQIPKMLAFDKGDLFETDAVDKGNFANVAAVQAEMDANEVFGVPDTSGYIKLLTTAEAGIANVWDTYGTVLKAQSFVNLPNDTQGIKFAVVQASHGPMFLSGRVFSSFGFLALDNIALAADVEGIFGSNNIITAEVPFGTDVTALIADFTASTDATVEVGGTEQESGTTENDFTEPVEYVVIAENGMTNTYTVIVTIAEDEGEGEGEGE